MVPASRVSRPASFATWKTVTSHDRGAPRDLWDLWALTQRGQIISHAAELFVTHGADWEHTAAVDVHPLAPTEERWLAQVAGQTRLTFQRGQALQVERMGGACEQGTRLSPYRHSATRSHWSTGRRPFGSSSATPGRLDAERMSTELGPILVTTPEQTVLDLARRPTTLIVPLGLLSACIRNRGIRTTHAVKVDLLGYTSGTHQIRKQLMSTNADKHV